MKNKFNYIAILLSIFLFFSCSKGPDTVYIKGKIYTLDKNNTISEALAVRDGFIYDIGSTNDLMDKYEIQNIIDLNGKTVLPGFIDCDGSIVEFSKNLNYINLSYATSLNEILMIVKEKVKEANTNEWIGGYGWNELNLPDEDLENMNKKHLDNISADVNIYLLNNTKNAVLCNSRALQTLNIDKNTPSPEKGEIQKDENGELTGLLFDNAVSLIRENLPVISRDDIVKCVEKGSKELLKYGIVMIQDRNIGKDGLSVIKELIDKNKMPIKIYAVLTATDETFKEYLTTGPENNYKDKLSIRAVCIDYDGAYAFGEASTSDYDTIKFGKKIPYAEDNFIDSILKISFEKNFQFRIKAVGDIAVNNILNIFSRHSKDDRYSDSRTVIEYIQFINQSDISKFSELKLIPSVRPEVCIYDFENNHNGEKKEIYNKMGLWNSLLKSSGLIITGSDFPFYQINPLIQIYYLTSRQSLDTVSNNILNDSQKISLLDAVKSYTIWAAYSSFDEEVRGSIEKGKTADLVVLSDDIFNIDIKKIPQVKVIKTIIGGKVLYEMNQ